MQLGEGPLGRMPIRAALLHAGILAMLAPSALAYVGQLLEADEAARISVHDLSADEVVTLVLQPSLSPRDHDEQSCRRASAFVLQALPQPGVVIRFGARLSARKELHMVLRVRGDGQVPLAHVHPDDALMNLWCRVSDLDLQTHQQVELLVWLVVPEPGSADAGTLLDKRHVSLIAGVGQNHAPTQRQDAYLVLGFQAKVPMIVVGERGRDVLGRSVQALIALLGSARLACGRVGLDLGPERFVRRTNLAGHIAGHLRGQAEARADV
jgi:hypothetical protein